MMGARAREPRAHVLQRTARARERTRRVVAAPRGLREQAVKFCKIKLKIGMSVLAWSWSHSFACTKRAGLYFNIRRRSSARAAIPIEGGQGDEVVGSAWSVGWIEPLKVAHLREI